MSEAAEYRLNAQVCAACGAATRSVVDRQIWRRMERAWLELAAREQERPDSAAA